ncbi:MAG: thioredoxin family protein [Vigna little leaf phytoplasma]|nr:thioredoxin family protein [Vigna little leaf phytoplasma]
MYKYQGEDYQEIINKKPIVLVDFYAEWCGPCNKMAPILEEISSIYQNIFFCKIDVDEYFSLAKQNKVNAFPTLILYFQGKEIKRQLGFCSRTGILNFLKV